MQPLLPLVLLVPFVCSAPLASNSGDGLWNVEFYVAVNSTNATKFTIEPVHRGEDPGWGVDVAISPPKVDANIWDTDGDSFFAVRTANASCSVDVGSNGLGPGAQVTIFQQEGLKCDVVQMGCKEGTPPTYSVIISAEVSHAHDCGSKHPGYPANDCPEPIMLKGCDSAVAQPATETSGTCLQQGDRKCMSETVKCAYDHCEPCCGGLECYHDDDAGDFCIKPPPSTDVQQHQATSPEATTCCACVKGSDMGSDLWSFTTKAGGADCSTCCVRAQSVYSSGKPEPAAVCASHKPVEAGSC